MAICPKKDWPQFREAIMVSLIQHFKADFLWSQPQNPEFRNNPENFHPCMNLTSKVDVDRPMEIGSPKTPH